MKSNMVSLGLVCALCMDATVVAAAERIDEVVVTATREAQELRRLSRQHFTRRRQRRVARGLDASREILNRAAGAMIQRNSGEESLTAIRSPVLTGPGSCGVFLFLENSVPIRPVGFCNVNEMFEVNFEQAQSIEVLRGPAGVVYGSGAMHGAMNVLQPGRTNYPRVAWRSKRDPTSTTAANFGSPHAGATSVGGTLVASHDGGWRDASGFDEQKAQSRIVAHAHGR